MNAAMEEYELYADLHWPAGPLYAPDENGVCDCYRKINGYGPDDPKHPIGKHPRLNDWATKATCERSAIRNIWGKMFRGANVGILTGMHTGLAVLDVDPRHGGGETPAALVKRHGPLPRTPTALTGGGGLHYFFKHTGGRIKSRRIAQGLDMKADGAFVVGPPSLHVSGKSHLWHPNFHPSDTPLAPMPLWLLEMAASTGGVAGRARMRSRMSSLRGSGTARSPAWRERCGGGA